MFDSDNPKWVSLLENAGKSYHLWKHASHKFSRLLCDVVSPPNRGEVQCLNVLLYTSLFNPFLCCNSSACLDFRCNFYKWVKDTSFYRDLSTGLQLIRCFVHFHPFHSVSSFAPTILVLTFDIDRFNMMFRKCLDMLLWWVFNNASGSEAFLIGRHLNWCRGISSSTINNQSDSN